MLAVEKVSRVPGVQRHGLERLPALQHAAGPLPHAARVGLPREAAPVARDRHGVPMLEAYVGAVEVDEELFWGG
jgi:hypothetical protein